MVFQLVDKGKYWIDVFDDMKFSCFLLDVELFMMIKLIFAPYQLAKLVCCLLLFSIVILKIKVIKLILALLLTLSWKIHENLI